MVDTTGFPCLYVSQMMSESYGTESFALSILFIHIAILQILYSDCKQLGQLLKSKARYSFASGTNTIFIREKMIQVPHA